MTDAKNHIAVVALGGNAISRPDQRENIHDQFRRTRESLEAIVALIRDGWRVAITHGNGPQVGNELQRNELARERVPALPLGVLVASTEGWMGYMIEQSLMNRLLDEKIDKKVVSVVTQVEVDPDDPSLKDPTKFVGQTYGDVDAKIKEEENGWVLKYDKGRDGWRRVVGSPKPLRIVNSEPIRLLIDQDWIVICAGGGGVPAYPYDNGKLEGVDAVVDKDLASAVLAKDIGAEVLFIITSVPYVSLNYGRKDQEDLLSITMDEAQKYLDIGHFAPGSMKPKVEAAIQFLRDGGKKVVITDLENIAASLKGNSGTTITK